MSAVAAELAPAHEIPSPDTCAHCDGPVPPALRDTQPLQFCCAGCRTVYDMLHSEGLGDYYVQRELVGASGKPARTTGRGYAEYDEPSFAALYCRDTAAGARATELYLEGLHCAACLWLVERLPRVCAGVIEARLDFSRSCVRVTWDPARVRLSEVARALDRLGYPPHPFRGVAQRDARRREDRAFLIRIAVAGAALGNVMLMAFALYSGLAGDLDPAYEQLFRWASLVVTAPSVFWAGNVFLRGAWAAVLTRTPHIDLPVSIGILAGFFWGGWNTIRGSGEIYFDSVTALVFALLVGRFMQRRQQRAASDAAELVHALAPSTARQLVDGEVREVPVAALVPDALVEVRAGDSLPVDGLVVEGSSSVDASILTGESLPVDVGPGALIHAGTLNLSARLVVRATRTGEATRVGRLMKVVEEAARRRAPVVQLADRLSGYFVVGALGLAALTAAWWWRVDPTGAIDHAVALLIVTCPCALGLATPLAVSAAIGKAARQGILIKGGDALELVARRARIYFDKTGTLTRGQMQLVTWLGDEGAKPLLAALEAHSAHPLARAALAALPRAAQPAEEVTSAQGGGLTGRVGTRWIIAGSPAFVGGCATISPVWHEHIATLTDRGLTPVVVAIDGEVVAAAGFGDPLRDDAAASMQALARLGYEPHVLSGDHPRVVEAVAAELGLTSAARGGASPEDKLHEIERARAEASVIMVGDGVNDAAALSAAHVGVAVHGGAEASLAAADVFLSKAGLASVVELVEGARRTLRVIHRGVAFSLLYNLVGLGLAMTGQITPLTAAILMPASSLTVVTVAYRSRTFGGAR